MGGRRRRDNGWDEDRGDQQEGWRSPWPDDGRGGWPDPGRGDGRHRAALPAPDAQGGYQPAMDQGGYQPATGQTDYRGGGATQGSAGYGDAGYGAGYGAAPGTAAYPGAGQGYGDPAYQQQAGYGQSGYAGNGYAGTGFDGAGAGAGYASGAADTRYGDQGGAGYGYSAGGYPDAGYGGAGWSGGGYQAAGYGQPAPGGSGFGANAAYDANSNGRMSGSYPADTAAAWRPHGEFPETTATGQYGHSPSWGPDQYLPSGQTGPANGIPSGTPRPYGRLSIFTLLEDKAAEFDRLAEQAAEGVRAAEPDTLVYVFHVVPKAPMQRIIYEIYRDREAFESHERQPHIQRFVADRKACVLATNIIDLRLKYAKVAALAASPAPAAPAPAPAAAPFNAPAPAPSASVQETRVNALPRALESGRLAESGGRYAGPGYGRLPGSDERVPRSRFVDWDQPAYQGQRPGGN